MIRNLIIAAFAVLTTGCATVEPGYVGIVVNQYGTQKGVQDFPVFTGRQFYNPWTQNVYTWPTYVQRVSWDKAGDDGRDDSITVRSSEGTSVNLDIAVAYRILPEKVPHIFVTFRQDIESLTNGFLRDRVRDTVNNHAAKIGVMQLLGPGMQKLTDDVLGDLQANLKNQGFIVDSVSIVGKPRVDQSVENSINNVVQATQEAIKAEQQVRQVEAEARKSIVRANAEAEAILATAKAQAESNRIIAESLNQYGDKVLQSKSIEKWNGVLPQLVTGGNATPFINLSNLKQQ